MKQVWILIISIMILVTAGICEIKFLNNSSKYLKADLDYIENAVLNNNYQLAKSQFDNTFSSWNELKDVWHIFVTSEEIDTINSNLIKLKHYLDYEKEEDSLIAIEQIKSSITHCITRQNLRIDNIL